MFELFITDVDEYGDDFPLFDEAPTFDTYEEAEKFGDGLVKGFHEYGEFIERHYIIYDETGAPVYDHDDKHYIVVIPYEDYDYYTVDKAFYALGEAYALYKKLVKDYYELEPHLAPVLIIKKGDKVTTKLTPPRLHEKFVRHYF